MVNHLPDRLLQLEPLVGVSVTLDCEEVASIQDVQNPMVGNSAHIINGKSASNWFQEVQQVDTQLKEATNVVMEETL